MHTIAKNTVVTLDYKVSDLDGIEIDDGKEPIVYLHGGYEGIFPRIEAALEGKSVGDMVSVTLQPAEGFGEYDAALVRVESKDVFSKPVEIGMVLEGYESEDEESRYDESEVDESKDVRLYRVTDIAEDRVVLDGNHPLAGLALVFECKVKAVRRATDEEIESGGCMVPD